MKIIRLHPDYWPAVLSGRKRSTVRRGRRSYVLGDSLLSTGQQETLVRITAIRYCLVRELTEEDAVRDGFNTLDELLEALHHFYPALHSEETVTIVFFRVKGDEHDIN